MGRPLSFDPQEVLSAIAELFRQQGFDGTSMRDVQRATGLSPTSLYAAFGNKEQLFERALERYRDQMTAMTIDAMGSPADGIGMVKRYFEMTVKNSCAKFGCLIGRTLIDGSTDRVGEIIRQTFNRVEALLTAAFVAAQEQGDVTPDHPAQKLAQFSMALSFGLQMQARRGVAQEEFEDLLRIALLAVTQYSSKPAAGAK